jgi:hypothetical protein
VAATESCVIKSTMPDNDGSPQYRIHVEGESHDRVVNQGSLEAQT